MAITDLVTRLTLNAKQFTSQFDTAIGQATAKAKSGGRQIGEGLSGEANAKLNEFAQRIPVLGDALGGLAGPALAAAAGIGAVTTALAFGIKEADAYAKESGKLDAVLKATGNSTGFTADQLRGLADELETTAGIAAEDFLAAERQLASFGGVAGSTFRQTIELSADLAATFGGDVVSNTEKLGTALQNLAGGDVEGLAKSFKFLGVETLDTIKALAEQGKTLEAQQALFDALRSRVGGSAAAGSDNLTGDFFRLADAVGDASREFVTTTGIYEAFRQNTRETIDEVNGLIDAFRNLTGTNKTPAPFSIAAGAAQFPGLPGVDVAQRGGELLAARAAADAAKAEGDKRRAAEAAAIAAKKQATEFERAQKATAQLKSNLNDAIGDLETQAKFAGQIKDDQERQNILRRLEVQFGEVLTDQQRQQISDAITLKQIREDIVRLRKDELDLFKQQADAQFGLDVDAARGRSFDPYTRELEKAIANNNPFVPKVGDQKTQQEIQRFSDQFYEIFSRGQGSFWDTFEQAGQRAAANTVARLVNDPALADLFKNSGLGDIGSAAGSIFEGASSGYAISSLFGKSNETRAGGAIGGAIGKATGLPGGEIVGSIWGSLIGGAFARDPYSGANLSTANGAVTSSGLVARGNGQMELAESLADGFSQSLNNLINALGGTLADGINLGTLGTNKDAFVFNATGTSTAAGAGGQRFADAEDAIEAALRNAIAKGAVAGVDASITRLLSQGDLQTQTAKASALANALRNFDQATDPFGVQVRTLTDEFTALRDIMIEAGSSTADLNRASADYDRRLEQIRESAGQATSTLRGFLDGLGFGSSSPLALGQQRDSALAAYNAQVARIGSAGFDQNAFTQAGQRVLDIEGQLFGRTDSFFTTFEQVQADTRRAINAIDRAAALNAENPFARATAAATEATAENTAGMLDALTGLPAMIGAQIAASLAALGIGGNGDNGRGFVTRMAA